MQIVREQRRKVLIRAKMRAGGSPLDVCIRDISAKGLMIQAAAPPPRGTYVEIVGADQTIVGRVVWMKDRRCGIHTCDPIDVTAAIRGIPARASRPGSPARLGPPCPAIGRTNPEFSRALARAMEFAVMAGVAAALVAALATVSYQALSRPFESISTHLGSER